MSKSKSLIKDLALCSKCYILCNLLCPICLKFKIKRHCKKHNNPSSLHWHLVHEHPDHIDSKFSVGDAVKALNGITWGLKHGMLE